jgi:hypothetical protein
MDLLIYSNPYTTVQENYTYNIKVHIRTPQITAFYAAFYPEALNRLI